MSDASGVTSTTSSVGAAGIQQVYAGSSLRRRRALKKGDAQPTMDEEFATEMGGTEALRPRYRQLFNDRRGHYIERGRGKPGLTSL